MPSPRPLFGPGLFLAVLLAASSALAGSSLTPASSQAPAPVTAVPAAPAAQAAPAPATVAASPGGFCLSIFSTGISRFWHFSWTWVDAPLTNQIL